MATSVLQQRTYSLSGQSPTYKNCSIAVGRALARQAVVIKQGERDDTLEAVVRSYRASVARAMDQVRELHSVARTPSPPPLSTAES